MALRSLLDEPLGVRHKAFPPGLAAVPLREVGGLGLSVPDGDLLLPALVLRETALAHNIAVMAAWCRRRGVSLAPHGKTTMAPQLFRRQLDAGAWAITAANVTQAAVMRDHGVRRVVIANEVVDAAGLRWIAETLDSDASFELFVLVDSTASVAIAHEAFAAAALRRPLPVLVELGVAGKRAGAREDETVRAVAAAATASAHLRVAGVECFEGVIGPGAGPDAVAQVGALLDRVGRAAARLDADGAFADAEEILLTAGGSIFFDQVAELRRHAGALSRPGRVLLRSGCYITHDHGIYDALSPLGSARGAPGAERLRAALELWAAVISRPEPGLAILGLGRRDAPFDADLPRPLRVLPADGGAARTLAGAEVFALNDQHAFLRIAPDAPLAVGDRVICGISHPCTAFDKWAVLPVIDDEDRVVGAIRTLF